MSLKRMLLASGAAFTLIGVAADASAQQYNRPNLERHKAQASTSRMPPARPAVATHRPVEAAGKPGEAAKKPVEAAAKVAPPPAPLSEAELAAKAMVDELLAREPALVAAKDKPDPALAKAAAAKHNALEQRLAALKAQEEAQAAKRKEIADKTKARDDKAAALKAKQDAQAKGAKPKVETSKPDVNTSKLDGRKTSLASAPQVEPLRRMPAP